MPGAKKPEELELISTDKIAELQDEALKKQAERYNVLAAEYNGYVQTIEAEPAKAAQPQGFGARLGTALAGTESSRLSALVTAIIPGAKKAKEAEEQRQTDNLRAEQSKKKAQAALETADHLDPRAALEGAASGILAKMQQGENTGTNLEGEVVNNIDRQLQLAESQMQRTVSSIPQSITTKPALGVGGLLTAALGKPKENTSGADDAMSVQPSIETPTAYIPAIGLPPGMVGSSAPQNNDHLSDDKIHDFFLVLQAEVEIIHGKEKARKLKEKIGSLKEIVLMESDLAKRRSQIETALSNLIAGDEIILDHMSKKANAEIRKQATDLMASALVDYNNPGWRQRADEQSSRNLGAKQLSTSSMTGTPPNLEIDQANIPKPRAKPSPPQMPPSLTAEPPVDLQSLIKEAKEEGVPLDHIYITDEFIDKMFEYIAKQHLNKQEKLTELRENLKSYKSKLRKHNPAAIIHKLNQQLTTSNIGIDHDKAVELTTAARANARKQIDEYSAVEDKRNKGKSGVRTPPLTATTINQTAAAAATQEGNTMPGNEGMTKERAEELAKKYPRLKSTLENPKLEGKDDIINQIIDKMADAQDAKEMKDNITFLKMHLVQAAATPATAATAATAAPTAPTAPTAPAAPAATADTENKVEGMLGGIPEENEMFQAVSEIFKDERKKNYYRSIVRNCSSWKILYGMLCTAKNASLNASSEELDKAPLLFTKDEAILLANLRFPGESMEIYTPAEIASSSTKADNTGGRTEVREEKPHEDPANATDVGAKEANPAASVKDEAAATQENYRKLLEKFFEKKRTAPGSKEIIIKHLPSVQNDQEFRQLLVDNGICQDEDEARTLLIKVKRSIRTQEMLGSGKSFRPLQRVDETPTPPQLSTSETTKPTASAAESSKRVDRAKPHSANQEATASDSAPKTREERIREAALNDGGLPEISVQVQGVTKATTTYKPGDKGYRTALEHYAQEEKKKISDYEAKLRDYKEENAQADEEEIKANVGVCPSSTYNDALENLIKIEERVTKEMREEKAEAIKKKAAEKTAQQDPEKKAQNERMKQAKNVMLKLVGERFRGNVVGQRKWEAENKQAMKDFLEAYSKKDRDNVVVEQAIKQLGFSIEELKKAEESSAKAAPKSQSKVVGSPVKKEELSFQDLRFFLQNTEEPKYTKFREMLNKGLPIGAVHNAMVRDGVVPDRDQLAAFLRSAPLPPNSNTSNHEEPPTQPGQAATPRTAAPQISATFGASQTAPTQTAAQRLQAVKAFDAYAQVMVQAFPKTVTPTKDPSLQLVVKLDYLADDEKTPLTTQTPAQTPGALYDEKIAPNAPLEAALEQMMINAGYAAQHLNSTGPLTFKDINSTQEAKAFMDAYTRFSVEHDRKYVIQVVEPGLSLLEKIGFDTSQLQKMDNVHQHLGALSQSGTIPQRSIPTSARAQGMTTARTQRKQKGNSSAELVESVPKEKADEEVAAAQERNKKLKT